MRNFAAFRLFAAFVVAALAVLPLSAAHAQVFSNNTPIAIPGSGIATPYPSTINVSGASAATGLRVRLKNFTHSFPADVGVLLVAPDGQSHQLIAPIPGSPGNPVSGITLTFENDAQTPLPNPLITGTFRSAGGNQAYDAPANTFPRRNNLGSLTVTLNGTWRLFVQDFAAGDFGSFAGGWEIEFFDIPQPRPSNAFTYQGRLDGGIADGFIDARFSLWNGRFSGSPSNLLAGPVEVNGIAIRGGLFTASVDLGVPVPTDIQTFLQVEVASPSGSGFVTLSPRQPMTATPLASVATGLGNVTSLPGGNVLSSGQGGIGFVGNNANLGIGTSSPGQVLDVRGNIALGNNGELRAASGEENLRMLRGTIGTNGAVLAGSGFTAVRTGNGAYTITFTTPFPGGPSSLPAVTVTAVSSTPRYVHTTVTTNSSVSYNVRDAAGNLVESTVTFIVLGPR